MDENCSNLDCISLVYAIITPLELLERKHALNCDFCENTETSNFEFWHHSYI